MRDDDRSDDFVDWIHADDALIPFHVLGGAEAIEYAEFEIIEDEAAPLQIGFSGCSTSVPYEWPLPRSPISGA